MECSVATVPSMHSGETPIVALLCIGDMRDFLANTLAGLLKVGIDPDRIAVGCRSSDRAMVESVVGSLPCHIQEVPEENPRGRPEQPGYASFGSTQFNDVSWMKIAFIHDLLTKNPHVIFSDLDVSWLRNPLPYLIEVARRYPIALQTECQPVFPPKVCCGFMSFTKDAASIQLLDLLLASDEANLASGERVYDQLALQTIIESDEDWLAQIFFLPETLFPVGIAHALVGGVPDPVPMEGTLEPFLFHANWTIGARSKRDLLERTGTWIVSDAVELSSDCPTVPDP